MAAQPDLPASPQQRRLLFLHELDPGSSAYNVFVAVRLHGTLDAIALRRALDQVVARHEILRTTFVSAGGEPRQLVGPAVPMPMPVTNATDDAVADMLTRWSREPFDLERGPLIRAKLVRTGPRRHVFALFLHHIVCDGWSLPVLFAELADIYAGRQLPSLSLQYCDYVREQRVRQFDRQIAWWREHLKGMSYLIHLPADRTARGDAGATYTRALPHGLIRQAAALGRSHRASAFMVLLAAYGALLGRVTGVRDLLVGSPVAGRLQPELEPLIGYFVNTLPLRVILTGDPSFAELIERVRRFALGAYDHQEVPFDLLVEELRPERTPGRPPLVQTMFTFEPEPLAEPRFTGLQAELIRVEPTAAKFDLDLTVQAGGGGYQLRATYATERMDAATAAALTDGYACLLEAAVATPDTRIGRLPLLDTAGRRTILVRSGVDEEGSLDPLPMLLAERVAATPDAPALDGDGGRLTYAELDAAANRLAHHLRDLGAGPDDVIGVCLRRSHDLLIALLGIWKAGAAYLPLDPDLPRARLRWMLSAARASTVLATRRYAPPGDCLLVEEMDLSQRPTQAPRVLIHPQTLAYVIFTSGSTGEPKAVGVPHRALANHARAIADRYGIGLADRVPQFANIGFDVAAEEIFPTWLGGGCVVLPGEAMPVPEVLSAYLAAERISMVNLPAGYWHRWTTCAGHRIPEPLRLVVIGSEPADPSAAARWTGPPLLNAYGVTEATVTATLHLVEGEPERPVPIGRPIAGTAAYVLGDDLEPVPTGVPGELYLGGAGLARGYLGRPGLTAERFIADPFGGGRLYRTGDRVRCRADGSIEFLGRLDDQLNVRGHRVEPGEVIAALLAHPAIQQAAVAADDELVGYVVPQLPGDLRAHLARRLPPHLIPAAFVTLDALPIGPNGKLDRAALPKPAQTWPADRTPPRTQRERRIARIWQQVLGTGDIGVHDNFFDLGGRSQLLVAARARIAEEMGMDLPLVAFYEHPTVASLAQHMDGSEESAAADRAPRLRQGLSRLRRQRELLQDEGTG